MTTISNKVVCITGASRGLGAALARAFSKEGAQLVLAARDVAGLDEIAASLPNTMAIQCDVTTVGELENLVDAVMGEFGQLDIMVNCAGNAVFGPAVNVTEREFDEVFGANVKGLFFGSKIAMLAMKEKHKGLIVNVAAETRGWKNATIYAAASAAIREMTTRLRIEAAEFNVRVSAIVAGGIDTPMWKEQEFLPFPPEVVPSRDFLEADAVAGLVIGLAKRAEWLSVPEIVCTPTGPLRT